MNDTELNSILEQLAGQIGNLTVQLAAANARANTLQAENDKLKAVAE